MKFRYQFCSIPYKRTRLISPKSMLKSVRVSLMNLENFKNQLDDICRENGIAMLGVFGSVARGEDNGDSDIDLLVKLKEPVGLVEFIQLEDKFVDLFGRKVDLATEAALHPLIKDNVLNDLKVLYEG